MISKKTKYGLKAMSYLARKGKGTPVLISEISEAENISKKFLEAILLQLKNSGFLGSKMGKGGGYYLLKEPSDVKLVSLYRILEGPVAPLHCVSLNYYEKCDDCNSEEDCKLNAVMLSFETICWPFLTNKCLKDLM